MGTRFDEISAQALKLPLRERVKLAQRLVSSLDDKVENDVEKLWVAEAERRLKELHSGKVKGIPAAEAFKKAHQALER
jgi:putative addiction module component (TIGR02574 family)